MAGKKGIVYIEIDGLRAALQGLDSRAVRRAARETLKELTQAAKAQAISGIREKFNVQRQDLNSHMRVKLPTFANLTGEIAISGTPLPLVYFGAKEIRRVSGGVIVQDRRSGRRQKRAKGKGGVTYSITPNDPKNLPNAFMAYHSRFGRVEVFQRKGRSRYPVRTFRSITIPSMFEQPRVLEAVTEKIQDSFDKRFAHHLRYFLEIAK